MKTVHEVLEQTELTYPMLNRLKDLGIIPRPQRFGRGRHKGVVGVYDDGIIDVINWVKLMQKRGFSLAEIAEQKRQELDEVQPFKPTEPYLLAIEAEPVGSYSKGRGEFLNWLNNQIEQQAPGYEPHTIKMEVVTRRGRKYLKPYEITIRPEISSDAASPEQEDEDDSNT